MHILPDLTTLTDAQLQEALTKRKDAKKQARLEHPFEVSEKGAISFYCARRFPITAYRDEWEEILRRADELKAFIEEHADELKPNPKANGAGHQ